MEHIKPFSPDEAAQIKGTAIHPGIIQVVNELLASKYDGSRSVVIQQIAVISLFTQRYPEYTPKRVLDEHLLDFEPLYRKEGWKVVYDKPGYNEQHYEPFWSFSRA